MLSAAPTWLDGNRAYLRTQQGGCSCLAWWLITTADIAGGNGVAERGPACYAAAMLKVGTFLITSSVRLSALSLRSGADERTSIGFSARDGEQAIHNLLHARSPVDVVCQAVLYDQHSATWQSRVDVLCC